MNITTCLLFTLLASVVPIAAYGQSSHSLDQVGSCTEQVSAYRAQLAARKTASRYAYMYHDIELAVLNSDVKKVASLIKTWRQTESRLDLDEALQSGLSMAAWSGNSKIAAFLLRNGASPDTWTNRTLGNNAIVLAAGCGHLKVVETIVQFGGKVAARSQSGKNAFEAAVEGDHQSIAQWLLSHGFKPCIEEHGDDRERITNVAQRSHMTGAITTSLACGRPTPSSRR